MGFFFRRSASFGPFRLNFSKSGVGASIGVKGARLTITPRGTTYITVGSHGFYYREAVSNASRGELHPSPRNVVGLNPTEEKLATADVLDLIDSSSAALIDRLNERARMINPAWFLYAVGAAVLALGIFLLVNGATPSDTPPLPDVTKPLSVGRKVNETDEYSLMLARYGEPNTVFVTPSRSVPLRTSLYAAAHLKIVFVPNGCVDAYEYEEAHKASYDTNLASSKLRRSRSRRSKSADKALHCVPPPDNGSTIVRYEDADNGSSVSAEDAKQRLDAIGWKSSSQPALALVVDSTVKQRPPRIKSEVGSQAASIRLNQETLRSEELRLLAIESEEARDRHYGIGLLLAGIGLLIGGGFLNRNSRMRRTTRLVYDLSEAEQQNQSLVEQSLKHLARSQVIWRVVAKSPAYDWKRNAGAAYLVRRTPAAVRTSSPPRVESNLAINWIDLGATRLYFLPDMILYWERGMFGAIGYDDLHVEQRPTRFIEEESVPSDAKQVDQTWRYVRKDGGPDRRFNNNFRIPVMQYGAVILTSSKGLNVLLNTSNVEASAAFFNCLLEFQVRRKAKGAPGRVASESPERIQPLYLNALKVLGLEPGASWDKISEAYRSLAQMYHPDKVAGLAPEFHEIAERRMKEINAAYQLLKRPSTTT